MRSILAALFTIICSGCSDPKCSNDVIQEVPSPNGRMKIVLFSRHCGATTGFNTQAMILGANEAIPDESGNAFIIDNGGAKATWTDDSRVSVIFDPDARIFKQENSVRGISIEYPGKSD